MGIAGISLSDADGQVFLRMDPVSDAPAIVLADLRSLLVESGYADWLCDEDALAGACREWRELKTPLSVRVAQRCEARVVVQVSADEMSADLSLSPPQGGKALTREDIQKALFEAGVQYGVNEAAVARALAQGHCNQLVIASGAPPVNGLDAQFEALIAETVDREPRLDENGLIDYREHSVISTVPAGTPLMRRIAPTQGQEGRTVRGNVLTARPGRDLPFASGLVGVEPAAEDPNLLRAVVSGQPVRLPHGVSVEPILRIPEVNMATGNIHFDGSVHVKGEVAPGMKVQASGDIAVDGMVDGGLLDAGGNIQVSGGVIAHAQLRAGGAVTVRFAEGASLSAGSVLAIKDMALECELRSLNQIIIGADSPQRGKLIGGTATAMMSLTVPVLGSDKGGLTKVTMGVNPALEARLEALQLRIAKEAEAEANLGKIVKQLTATGDPRGMLERVKATRKQAGETWGRSLAERGELEKQIALGLTASVRVDKAVSGAVDLTFGKLSVRLRREFDAGSFALNEEGHVLFTDRSGKTFPVA